MKKLMMILIALLVLVGFMGCDTSNDSGGGGGNGNTIPSDYQNTTWVSEDSLMTITLELRVTDFIVTTVFKNSSNTSSYTYTVDDVEEGTLTTSGEPIWAVHHTSTNDPTFYPYLYRDKLYVTAGSTKFTKQ